MVWTVFLALFFKVNSFSPCGEKKHLAIVKDQHGLHGKGRQIAMAMVIVVKLVNVGVIYLQRKEMCRGGIRTLTTLYVVLPLVLP